LKGLRDLRTFRSFDIGRHFAGEDNTS
jgi:hypothetical protein